MYIGSGILFTLIYKTDKVKLLYEKVLNRNSSLRVIGQNVLIKSLQTLENKGTNGF